MSAIPTAAARLADVSKVFTVGEDRVVALDGASLEVAKGELACVHGASGSGKSTLLHVLAGIEVPDRGEVVAAGRSLVGLSEGARADHRLHHVGVVFQADHLLPELTASENVTLPLLVRGLSRGEAGAAASSALEAVGVLDLAGRRPARMSGGQRQRVGIARALAGGQELLLADEPTGALDSAASRALFGLLRTLCDERGVSVVLATHDPLALDVAHRVHEVVDGVVHAR